jgi:hypothetical protein
MTGGHVFVREPVNRVPRLQYSISNSEAASGERGAQRPVLIITVAGRLARLNPSSKQYVLATVRLYYFEVKMSKKAQEKPSSSSPPTSAVR